MLDGTEKIVSNPCDYPDNISTIAEEFEPVVNSTIIVPQDYYSAISQLCRVQNINNFF